MRPKSPATALLVVAVTVGCAHATATPVTGPDGATWYSISCRRDQANCEELAGEVCPSGYEVAGASGSAGTALYVNSYAGVAYAHPTYQGHMMIKCRVGVTEKVYPTTPAPSSTAAVSDEPRY
jgi:hypothetical protein